MAEEYLHVCYKLWETSWDDDAVQADRQSGVYADPRKVHGIDHQGTWFKVPGFHLSEPSPQRSPVIYQAGAPSLPPMPSVCSSPRPARRCCANSWPNCALLSLTETNMGIALSCQPRHRAVFCSTRKA